MPVGIAPDCPEMRLPRARVRRDRTRQRNTYMAESSHVRCWLYSQCVSHDDLASTKPRSGNTLSWSDANPAHDSTMRQSRCLKSSVTRNKQSQHIDLKSLISRGCDDVSQADWHGGALWVQVMLGLACADQACWPVGEVGSTCVSFDWSATTGETRDPRVTTTETRIHGR